MERDKGISSLARMYVAHKLKLIEFAATRGTGSYYELSTENFRAGVDQFIARVKNPKLREYIKEQAIGTGDYPTDPGHWYYHHRDCEVYYHFGGEKVADLYSEDMKWGEAGPWVAKSSSEVARPVMGQGQDGISPIWEPVHYVGIETSDGEKISEPLLVEKYSDQRTAESHAQELLQQHLGFAPSKREQSGELGEVMHSEACRRQREAMGAKAPAPDLLSRQSAPAPTATLPELLNNLKKGQSASERFGSPKIEGQHHGVKRRPLKQ